MPPLVVTVACRKGGVGKTTTAIGVASWFALLGKRTAIIELDDQANVAYCLSCQLDAPGAAELLVGQQVTPQAVPGVDNLWVYVGTNELLNAGVNDLDPEQLGDIVAGLDLDVVVIDCPPKGEHLERLGLAAASVCLIPIMPHPLAVNGAQRIHALISGRLERGRQAPTRLGLIVTRYDQRKKLDRDLTDPLKDLFVNVPSFPVRADEQIAKDMADQASFVAAHPDCRGSQDYRAVVKWILEGKA